MEGWRDAVIVEGGVPRMAVAGSRSSETQGDFLLSEVRVLQMYTEEDGRSASQVKEPPQKRTATRVESAETQDDVPAPPLTSRMEAKNELSFIPSAFSEPRWALHTCDKKCGEGPACGYCDRHRYSSYDEPSQDVLQCKATEAKRRGSGPSRRPFEGSCGQQLVRTNSCAECGNVSTIKKTWARLVLADAESVRQHGTNGKWQHETPYKEELELVGPALRRCAQRPIKVCGGQVIGQIIWDSWETAALGICESERMLQ